jgi:hypothetical protein
MTTPTTSNSTHEPRLTTPPDAQGARLTQMLRRVDQPLDAIASNCREHNWVEGGPGWDIAASSMGSFAEALRAGIEALIIENSADFRASLTFADICRRHFEHSIPEIANVRTAPIELLERLVTEMNECVAVLIPTQFRGRLPYSDESFVGTFRSLKDSWDELLRLENEPLVIQPLPAPPGGDKVGTSKSS